MTRAYNVTFQNAVTYAERTILAYGNIKRTAERSARRKLDREVVDARLTADRNPKDWYRVKIEHVKP